MLKFMSIAEQIKSKPRCRSKLMAEANAKAVEITVIGRKDELLYLFSDGTVLRLFDDNPPEAFHNFEAIEPKPFLQTEYAVATSMYLSAFHLEHNGLWETHDIAKEKAEILARGKCGETRIGVATISNNGVEIDSIIWGEMET